MAAVSKGGVDGIAQWLRLASRPGELFEQPISGGAVRYSGPHRVSARALGKLCAKAGLHYTLVPRNSASAATVEVGAPVGWTAPPALTSATTRDVVSYLHKALPDAQTDVVPQKQTGATRVVRLRPNTAELRVPSTLINVLLQAPGVLDAVLSPSFLAVTIAASSDKLGSLSHLSHSGGITPRMARITPLQRPKKAGKRRKPGARRSMFGRKAAMLLAG